MLGAFILLVCVCMVYKNCHCRKKRRKRTTDDGQTVYESDSDSDSFEEDDDICIEDNKPKNPFYFKKAMAKKMAETAGGTATGDDPYANERYKFYGSKMPTHAKASTKKTTDNKA